MGNLTKNNLIEILSEKIERKEMDKSIIYWNNKIYSKGDRIKIGPKTLVMPFSGYITAIDLEPEAKQYHSTRVLLVNIETKGIFTFTTRLNPNNETILSDMQILLSYGEIPKDD